MPCATSAPESPKSASAASGMRQAARASRRSARLERIFSRTRPPVSFSQSGATPSHMVLMRLAPIASCVSITRWTMAWVSGVWPETSSTSSSRTSTSAAPPPRARICGWSALAASSSACLWASSASRAFAGSARSMIWIWPIIRGGSLSVVKPPPSRAILAARLTAAITEGSSTAIGTSTSSPSTTKLSPMPTGRPSTPTAFSIIASALASGRLPLSPRPPRSETLALTASASLRSRSAILDL